MFITPGRAFMSGPSRAVCRSQLFPLRWLAVVVVCEERMQKVQVIPALLWGLQESSVPRTQIPGETNCTGSTGLDMDSLKEFGHYCAQRTLLNVIPMTQKTMS